jgi:hypothetical protein
LPAVRPGLVGVDAAEHLVPSCSGSITMSCHAGVGISLRRRWAFLAALVAFAYCLLAVQLPRTRGVTPALRPLRGECPAFVAAGRGYPAALLRALPASAASACRTPGSLELSSGLSLLFAFLHSVLCSRALGFPNVHSAVHSTKAVPPPTSIRPSPVAPTLAAPPARHPAPALPAVPLPLLLGTPSLLLLLLLSADPRGY